MYRLSSLLVASLFVVTDGWADEKTAGFERTAEILAQQRGVDAAKAARVLCASLVREGLVDQPDTTVSSAVERLIEIRNTWGVESEKKDSKTHQDFAFRVVDKAIISLLTSNRAEAPNGKAGAEESREEQAARSCRHASQLVSDGLDQLLMSIQQYILCVTSVSQPPPFVAPEVRGKDQCWDEYHEYRQALAMLEYWIFQERRRCNGLE